MSRTGDNSDKADALTSLDPQARKCHPLRSAFPLIVPHFDPNCTLALRKAAYALCFLSFPAYNNISRQLWPGRQLRRTERAICLYECSALNVWSASFAWRRLKTPVE